MRNPNGYGTVAKLSGNRRKPFVVRKTIGFNHKGHPIYKTLGYYATREAGMIALALYNKDPYDIDKARITMLELYEKFLQSSMINKLGKSSISSLKSAFKHCENIHGMRYKEIKAYHMQDCIDNCGKGYSTQGSIKTLFKHLDRFALALDIDIKSFSLLTTAESVPETSKRPFTDKEVTLLWENKDFPWIDSVLVFLYSGWRISELLGLRLENVDLEIGTMQGGVKTKSGKGRIVPIHSKIFPLVKSRYEEGHTHLFGVNGKGIVSSTYYKFWNEIMDKLEMNHTPHECRHTFRSWLDTAEANKVAVDRLMGHVSTSTGERVYTHKSIEELKAAIELIKV